MQIFYRTKVWLGFFLLNLLGIIRLGPEPKNFNSTFVINFIESSALKRAARDGSRHRRLVGKIQSDLTQAGAVVVQTQVSLEGVQLSHEVEVGRDVRLARAHQLERVAQAEPVALHEVRERHGHGARHARHAVHEHAASGRHGLLCNEPDNESLTNKLTTILSTGMVG